MSLASPPRRSLTRLAGDPGHPGVPVCAAGTTAAKAIKVPGTASILTTK